MENEEKKIQSEINKAVEEEKIYDFVSDYLPELFSNDMENLIALAKQHDVDLTVHSFSCYIDKCEPDYFIFELRIADKEVRQVEAKLKKVASILFSQLNCCEGSSDEAAKIEVWSIDEDKEKPFHYVRIRFDGHYHS